MTTKFEEFRKLHSGETPLLIGNVWNVQTALQYEKLGFKAIGTSSAAIANDLGYEDGEDMPFEDYFFMIKRIAISTKLPLTVDLEAGYGSTAEAIITNIIRLHEVGVVGINIEDSEVKKSERKIEDAEHFTIKLKAIVGGLKKRNIPMFINVRCDAFLLDLSNALNESIQRIKEYKTANIDGVFLPCITNANDIKMIAETIDVPLNVMCMSNLPNFEALKTLGVKRISMGNFMHAFFNKQLEVVTKEIIEKNSFSPIF